MLCVIKNHGRIFFFLFCFVYIINSIYIQQWPYIKTIISVKYSDRENQKKKKNESTKIFRGKLIPKHAHVLCRTLLSAHTHTHTQC